MYKDRFHFSDLAHDEPRPARRKLFGLYAAGVIALAAVAGWTFDSHVIPAARAMLASAPLETAGTACIRGTMARRDMSPLCEATLKAWEKRDGREAVMRVVVREALATTFGGG